MTRRRPHVLLSALAVSTLLPFDASAGTFEFGLLSKTASAVKVRARVVVNRYFPCPGAVCSERTVTIRVSPCPPGQSCVGDTYEFTTGDVQLDIALDPNVNYTFTGNYVQRSSNQNYPPCVYTCTHVEPLGPVSYRTPPASAWNVSVVSTGEDTVLVDVSLTDYSGDDSWCALRQSDCFEDYSRTYKITPCPLGIIGDYVENYCQAGSMSYFTYSKLPQRFALQPGVTYTIGGYATSLGRCANITAQCELQCCGYNETTATRTFNSSTVSTRPTTWGHVKSLYRGP